MQEPITPFTIPSIEDRSDCSLDLNVHLIHHPAATFFIRVEGDLMLGAGIASGDLLIVDRALTALAGDIVVAIVHGEFTVRRLKKERDRIVLCAEPLNGILYERGEGGIHIWGVVTYAIRTMRTLCTR